MDDNDLVLFNTYYSDAEAYIDKGMLETNGVKCMITNEIMSSVYPLTITPLGAIKLWVSARDTEMAMRIVKSRPVDGDNPAADGDDSAES